MVSPDSWDSNSGKVRRGRGNGVPRLEEWGGKMDSPGFWYSSSGKVMWGRVNGIPRLLLFQQGEGEEGEGEWYS
jgi:hypothetical protein